MATIEQTFMRLEKSNFRKQFHLSLKDKAWAFCFYHAEPVADVVAVTFTAILFAVQFRKSLQTLK